MSEFYHGFVPGFNAWYVIWPMLVAAAAVIGAMRYYLNERWLIRTTFSTAAYLFFIIAMDAGLVTMFFAESWKGLLQVFLNDLGQGGDPVLAKMRAGAAAILVVMAMTASLFYAGYYGGQRRISVLRSERRRYERQERKMAESRRRVASLYALWWGKEFLERYNGPEIEWFTLAELEEGQDGEIIDVSVQAVPVSLVVGEVPPEAG